MTGFLAGRVRRFLILQRNVIVGVDVDFLGLCFLAGRAGVGHLSRRGAGRLLRYLALVPYMLMLRLRRGCRFRGSRRLRRDCWFRGNGRLRRGGCPIRRLRQKRDLPARRLDDLRQQLVILQDLLLHKIGNVLLGDLLQQEFDAVFRAVIIKVCSDLLPGADVDLLCLAGHGVRSHDVDMTVRDGKARPTLLVHRDIAGGAADADDHGGGADIKGLVICQRLINLEKQAALHKRKLQPFGALDDLGAALLV